MMQLDLFNTDVDHAELVNGARQTPANTPLCWTKMQAESGQSLDDIVARKELERQAGIGLFYWGIGNAVNFQNYLDIPRMPVVFSTMISRPKNEDINPSGVLVWRKYRDEGGSLRDLPQHVLILSRSTTLLSNKVRHCALICYSELPLRISDFGEFNPSGYINAGGQRKPVGFSQVTSLLTPTQETQPASKYRINMRAELLRPFSVVLADAVLLSNQDRRLVDEACRNTGINWVEFASIMRERLARASPITQTAAALRARARHTASLI
jgi:hypothetical protein